ncbi:MAG: phosphotransferase [Actinomycetota bacterium]
MEDRIHDHELDTSEGIVRALLASQLPAWADATMARLDSSGTTNALWRLTGADGSRAVARLPRMESGAAGIETESALLPALAATDLGRRFRLPELVHVGRPQDAYPLPWLVSTWLDGEDLWTLRDAPAARSHELADDLAAIVASIGSLQGLAAPDRAPGSRGGPLRELLEQLRRWLEDPRWRAADLVDVAAIGRLADEAAEVADGPTPRRFVHGDLIPGNLLVSDGRPTAIIDWGGAGHGDPAQDLAPAWSILDHDLRRRFRDAVGADDATWLRARTIELEHALGGVLYYRPRGHALGDVMARTLDRILDDSI